MNMPVKSNPTIKQIVTVIRNSTCLNLNNKKEYEIILLIWLWKRYSCITFGKCNKTLKVRNLCMCGVTFWTFITCFTLNLYKYWRVIELTTNMVFNKSYRYQFWIRNIRFSIWLNWNSIFLIKKKTGFDRKVIGP